MYWYVCLTPVLSFVPGPRLSSKPRKDKDPSSLRHAVDDSTGYSATPLAPTLAYVYPQLVSSATLAMNPAVAASSAGQTGFSNTKVREITGTQLVEQVALSQSRVYYGSKNNTYHSAPPPPPFAILALVQNGGGAYTQDVTFSLVIALPVAHPHN